MNFFENIAARFYLTFIYENRWSFFLDGLWMTILLTASSFLLGTMFGALFCRMRLSGSRLLRNTANLLTNLLVQLPTVVLLLVFAYVIFGSAPLSLVVIAIFALTLKTAAYMAEIFHSAVTSVEKGEIEAAYTLGLSRIQTFCHVTLPQAVASALPVYKNQFVITLQETSIVGYLSIMDLTRASDIVTTRTLDAMFGLISVAVLYLLIGWLGSTLLNVLAHQKHLGGEEK